MGVKPAKRRSRKTAPRAQRPGTGAESTSTELLWGRTARPRPGPKASLTTSGIATVAIAIADAEGLAAVSMKRIADSFGFTTMSLYRYVPGKTELVDLMFDTAMGPPPSLAGGVGGWRPKLERWTRALWSKVLRHPWALEVLTRLRVPGPNELAWMESGVAALAETRLSGPVMLDVQIRGAAQYAVNPPESGHRMTAEQWADGVNALLQLHGRDFPALRAAVATGALQQSGDPLDFGLHCVLSGLETLVTSAG
jgi:AcrR family transcriptional regulator